MAKVDKKDLSIKAQPKTEVVDQKIDSEISPVIVQLKENESISKDANDKPSKKSLLNKAQPKSKNVKDDEVIADNNAELKERDVKSENKYNELRAETKEKAERLSELEARLAENVKKTPKDKNNLTEVEKAEQAKMLALKVERDKAKAEFKTLNHAQKKATKERVKVVKKLNAAHQGPKDVVMHEGNVIELKNVVKYYSNGYLVNKIIKGIDLDIAHGEFIVILGPSGSGKTTLMNIISGLDRASEGQTSVCGKNLINLTNNELTRFRRQHVGYIFQQYGLLPNLTVKENVEIGSYLQKDKSKKLDVTEILESVDMVEHINKFPHELSGGQQQRVSIARAFAKNPTILFGDEPTGAIDEEMSKMVLEQFVQINKKFKTTVVMVTHNPIFADLGTCVIKVKDGQINELIRDQKPKPVRDLNWQ